MEWLKWGSLTLLGISTLVIIVSAVSAGLAQAKANREYLERTFGQPNHNSGIDDDSG